MSRSRNDTLHWISEFREWRSEDEEIKRRGERTLYENNRVDSGVYLSVQMRGL